MGASHLNDSAGPTGTLFQRNVWWNMLLARLLAEHEDLRRQIPDGAEFVVLPADDPELALHNMDVANQHGAYASRVLVRIHVTGKSRVHVQPWFAAAPANYALA